MDIEKLEEIKSELKKRIEEDANVALRSVSTEYIMDILDALLEEPKEKWEPKMGEKYWIAELGVLSGVHTYTYRADGTDRLYKKNNNMFRTEEEAEQVKDKIKELLTK